MGFLERWRRLPYLDAESQRFVSLEILSTIIITAGSFIIMFTMVYEATFGGFTETEASRVLRILVGFFIVMTGLIILLIFMYRHVSALESRLEDLKAPKEPKAYQGAIEGTEYVKKMKERKDAEKDPDPTDEQIEAMKMEEMNGLARRIKALEESFDDKGEIAYHKCPMCGALFTEEWDICPKCNARIGASAKGPSKRN